MEQGFTATIEIIGINPYVLLPEKVLALLFDAAGKNKGPIPVKGTLNGFEYRQTLVKYSGKWRLYLNGPMRTGAGIDVGDQADVTIVYDDEPRDTPMHPKLNAALSRNKKALAVFDSLAPHLQKEMTRYFQQLKTEESVDKNIKRAINFLLGKERFIGRDPLGVTGKPKQ